MGKKCLHDVAVANGVISAVHVEEEGEREKVCVHILPSGLSVMPASNWICASWMMEQVCMMCAKVCKGMYDVCKGVQRYV